MINHRVLDNISIIMQLRNKKSLCVPHRPILQLHSNYKIIFLRTARRPTLIERARTSRSTK